MGDNFYECVSGFDTDVSVEDAVRILDSLAVPDSQIVDADDDGPKRHGFWRAIGNAVKEFNGAVGKSLFGGLGLYGLWQDIKKELKADKDWSDKQRKAMESLTLKASAESILSKTQTVQIGYGACKLPEGFYLLSAYGVTSDSVASLSFQMPIIMAINWDAYKKFYEESAKFASSEKMDDENLIKANKQRLAALYTDVKDEALTSRFGGKDFMKYISSNPVSGDYELQLIYAPKHDMLNGFLLNVSGSNGHGSNKFSLSVLQELKGELQLFHMPNEQR